MLGRTELESLTVTSALGGRLNRGFEMAGFLGRDELVALLTGAVRSTVIAGGAAGNHTVTGIRVGDALRSVLSLDVAQGDHAIVAHGAAAGGPEACAGAAVAAHVGAVGCAAAASDGQVFQNAADLAHGVTQPTITHANIIAGIANHAAVAHVRTWAVADLTAEFTITAPNTINNAGGTNTTGRALLVVYEDLTP